MASAPITRRDPLRSVGAGSGEKSIFISASWPARTSTRRRRSRPAFRLVALAHDPLVRLARQGWDLPGRDPETASGFRVAVAFLRGVGSLGHGGPPRCAVRSTDRINSLAWGGRVALAEDGTGTSPWRNRARRSLS